MNILQAIEQNNQNYKINYGLFESLNHNEILFYIARENGYDMDEQKTFDSIKNRYFPEITFLIQNNNKMTDIEIDNFLTNKLNINPRFFDKELIKLKPSNVYLSYCSHKELPIELRQELINYFQFVSQLFIDYLDYPHFTLYEEAFINAFIKIYRNKNPRKSNNQFKDFLNELNTAPENPFRVLRNYELFGFDNYPILAILEVANRHSSIGVFDKVNRFKHDQLRIFTHKVFNYSSIQIC